MHRRIVLFSIVLLSAGFALDNPAQSNSTSGRPAASIATAKKFLATLDDSQRAKLIFDFKDEAQRKQLSNLPTAAFPRGGLRTDDLTDPPRRYWPRHARMSFQSQRLEGRIDMLEVNIQRAQAIDLLG
jgi:Protein of unknown function (DUF3500)